MVFCGKPSKGCALCRTRRIKCDQLDPACSQCLRAGKECPGYRDPLSLMFRDENDKVVTKARVPKAKTTADQRKRTPCLTSGSNSRAGTPSTNDSQEIMPLRLPSPSSTTLALEDEGIRFFFNHYSPLGTPQSAADQELRIRSSPMFPLIAENESSHNAVSSVGSAGLYNVTKDPKHMIVARKKYAASLRDITRSLGDLAHSDLDATFKAVMLLTAFEIVNGSSQSIGIGTSWGVHIDGGAAILKMLTSAMPAFRSDSKGWIQFIFAVYIKSLSRGDDAPAEMRAWAEACKKDVKVPEGHAIDLTHIIYRFTNLHASLRQGLLLDSNIVVLETLVLDAELEDWETNLPEEWKFETVPAPDIMYFTYNGKTHNYHDFWVGRILNNHRWARILVNELLMVHMVRLGTSGAEYKEQRRRSYGIIERMATDICTGISASFFRHSSLGPGQKDVPAMSGIFIILFPLAVAGSAMGVSQGVHEWVINTLRFIGNRMGICQAILMIELIRKQRKAFEEETLSHVITNLWGAV